MDGTKPAKDFDGKWTITPVTPEKSLGLLGYSLRRYVIDCFLIKAGHGGTLRGRILDIGGMRESRRGVFRPECYASYLVTLNLVKTKRPDILADAKMLPFQANCFDAVLCSEVLEHVLDPAAVLHNTFRTLKPGGMFVATVPFINPIHADPDDFGRYTPSYWKTRLEAEGFDEVEIIPQGNYLAIGFDFLRLLLLNSNQKPNGFARRIFGLAVSIFLTARSRFLNKCLSSKTPRGLEGYVGGYGILARRP